MDLQFSDAELEFRARAREWLTANVPTATRPANGPGAAQFDRDWQRKLYDNGWAGVAWPKEFGGRGATPIERVIWSQEEGELGQLGGVFIIGQGMFLAKYIEEK